MDLNSLLTIISPPMPYYMDIGKVTYQPGDKHPDRKNLGVFDFIFVIKGCLFIGEEDQRFEVSAGQSLILLPDKYHYSVKPIEEETVFYWIHFQVTGEWQEILTNAASLLNKSPAQPNDRSLTGETYAISIRKYETMTIPEQIYTLLEQLMELSYLSRSASFWQQQILFVQLLKTMDKGQKADYSSPAVIVADKIEAYIKGNYRNEITNDSLAEVLHFHPNYLARCMKSINGCTPIEYLINYRLEQAKLLLIKTDRSIAHIAEAVGFQYTPYFSKRFKEKNGISPLQYRKQFA
ncbi:AraC family transcriptional regulator [Paenibacillus psychroresistens]|uniref:AraC family transcriptional regulator n=1 Tax=Paenibacillus psychroresistens TaxID=1778678 RepID=A0A6B8RKN6_9BACL|nr:AraC family transcriptional regulator [Paenibacillus psychroresistens]QGQ95918.1 AraC family transcriptional regulator [Paenibacillus psychroresistens]